MLRLTIETGAALLSNRLVLGFVPHPYEESDQEALAEREDLLGAIRRVSIGYISNPLRYAIAHIVVTSGGPNETVAGAFARNDRMLYFRDEQVDAWMRDAGSEDGRWFVAAWGAMQEVNSESFAAGFTTLLTEEGRAKIRARQEERFPLPAAPEMWDTAPAIVDFLEKIAGE